jgi:chloramphenicol 3-O phosphotransferase
VNQPAETEPFVIILNGASSAGKTSIARAIQRLSPTPILHASLDTFTEMFLWPEITDKEVRTECHEFGISSLHAALPILASGRFPLVVDHVFEQPSWYERCAYALRGKRSYLIGVRCPLPVLELREKARGDRKIGLARAHLDRVHDRKPYAFEVDTSLHTPDESAALILKFITQAEMALQGSTAVSDSSASA